MSTAASTVLRDLPVVAHVVRGGFVESVHHGAFVVVDADGHTERSAGDPSAYVFPRSSNKPLQALAMVRAGLDLSPELLAIVCASHSGEPRHIAAVRAVLAAAGLTEADLQNTPSLPLGEAERDAWIRAGNGPASVVQNCSGKHAGMLATCVARGWGRASYRDVGHPLQRAIAATLAELSGEPIGPVAVDGCGAPVMALTLAGLARAFGRLASAPEGSEPARVADAMRTHPELVGGTRRDVTALMRGTAGVVAKDGAEGVYAVGLPDGRGVAVKIADGADRARTPVLAALLRSLGVASTAYERLEEEPVLGHGQRVGSVVAVGI